MTILRLTDRKAEVRASGPGAYVRQRIAEAAEGLNLAGTLAARVELANEALCRLTELMYIADTDGAPVHVDPVSLRICVPLPWGSAGWRRWGLRAHEATVLRRILLSRQASHKEGQRPPLFVYDADLRYWTLNAPDYPSHQAAAFWLRGSAIKLAEWRALSQSVLSGYRIAYNERTKRLG